MIVGRGAKEITLNMRQKIGAIKRVSADRLCSWVNYLFRNRFTLIISN